MIRVAVAGALGRMGTVARAALGEAHDVEYVGGLVRSHAVASGDAEGEPRVFFDDVEQLFEETKPDVLLDLTTYPATVEISRAAIRAGVRPVIGATGWSDFDRNALAQEAEERKIGAMLVPNFSIGAALMVRFAAEATRYFPSVEIVEMHHDAKKDKPSGTALLTAQRISENGHAGSVPIHSVRLRGVVAHQEVLFGGEGELLTIRHDALSRDAFVAGMLAAVRTVMHLDRLVAGIEAMLDGAERGPSA